MNNKLIILNYNIYSINILVLLLNLKINLFYKIIILIIAKKK